MMQLCGTEPPPAMQRPPQTVYYHHPYYFTTRRAKTRCCVAVTVAIIAASLFVGSIPLRTKYQLVRQHDEVISQSLSSPNRNRRHRCTPTQKDFQRHSSQTRSWLGVSDLGCPAKTNPVMQTLQATLPRASVFVDIGSNKGYFGAHIVQAFMGSTIRNVITNKALQSALRTVATAHSLPDEVTGCGACNDCEEPTFEPLTRSQAHPVLANPNSLHIVSFDANILYVNALNYAIKQLDQQHFPQKSMLQPIWKVELAAFTDSWSEGKTIEFVPYAEVGHVLGNTYWMKDMDERHKNQSRLMTNQVPALTVDRMLVTKGLDHIDLLKIDCEGHDPAVLRGAINTITSHKATIIMFEYNSSWEPTESLAQIVQWMEKMEYICYLEGRTSMVKLNYGCWHDRYEIRTWSNIWCCSGILDDGIAVSRAFDGMCDLN